MRLLSVAQCRRVDALAVARGHSSLHLMETAGQNAAAWVRAEIAPRWVLGFCGTGNNGGDGLVMLRALADAEWSGLVVVDGRRGWSADARANMDRLPGRVRRYEAEGLSIDALVQDLPVNGPGVLLDAVYGTGYRVDRGLGEAGREGLGLLRAIRAKRRDAVVVAVDVPSGVDADRGVAAAGAVIPADVTLTFAAMKPAMVGIGAERVFGRVVLLGIGVDEELLEEAGRWAAEEEG